MGIFKVHLHLVCYSFRFKVKSAETTDSFGDNERKEKCRWRREHLFLEKVLENRFSLLLID